MGEAGEGGGMKERHIHTARVYLREAIARRGTAFSWTLLQWAGNARRRAAACVAPAAEPVQPDLAGPLQLDLFGGAA